MLIELKCLQFYKKKGTERKKTCAFKLLIGVFFQLNEGFPTTSMKYFNQPFELLKHVNHPFHEAKICKVKYVR